jgi:hypothetical protein
VLDVRRQFHHVPHGQLQDLTGGHDSYRIRQQASRQQHPPGGLADISRGRNLGLLGDGGYTRSLRQASHRSHFERRRPQGKSRAFVAVFQSAYALPAKLAVPMMVCIFPVLFVVILLPVIVRLHVGGYF